MSNTSTKTKQTYNKQAAHIQRLIDSGLYPAPIRKLTTSEVNVMCNLRRKGMILRVIAAAFDVSEKTVLNQTWHVPHGNRLNKNITVNRRTGKRFYR